MSDVSSYLLATLLGLTSAGLIIWHIRSRQRLAEEELGEREREFRRRQFRRRVQTSALLGLLGVAILVGQLLMDAHHSWRVKVAYWIGVLGLVLWIALLAIADMAATSIYYSREKTDFVVQHAKLQAELRKARKEEERGHNGKPGPNGKRKV
jgi:hypothetical protein